ncbi:hypothetical protein ACFLS9_01995, partial [Bacteroidota bacterium]
SIIPSFVFSILNLILIYLLAYELTKKKSVAILSCFLLSFFPIIGVANKALPKTVMLLISIFRTTVRLYLYNQCEPQ